jgi:hypothetical protein
MRKSAINWSAPNCVLDIMNHVSMKYVCLPIPKSALGAARDVMENIAPFRDQWPVQGKQKAISRVLQVECNFAAATQITYTPSPAYYCCGASERVEGSLELVVCTCVLPEADKQLA